MSRGSGKSFLFEGSDEAWLPKVEVSDEERAKGNHSLMNSMIAGYDKKIDNDFEKKRIADQLVSERELKTANNMVLIKRCKDNPFHVIQSTQSGIILSAFDGSFINPDSGEEDKMEPTTEVGIVIDPGEASWLKEGDYIFYRRASTYDIPYMRKGYEVLAHQNILCYVTKKQTNE